MSLKAILAAVTKKRKVGIPKALIERLKPFGPRFLKVEKPLSDNRKTGKKAVEHGWTMKLYDSKDASLQVWMREGGNYGVAFGEGLIGIDLDEGCFSEHPELMEQLPETLTVQSGSGKGRHLYYRSDATDNGVIKLADGTNIGNVQAHNKYVVGPRCKHYTGGLYQIIKDKPISWISKVELEAVFGELLNWTARQLKQDATQSRWEQKQIGIKIKIGDVVDMKGLIALNKDEYQGEHPVHGSTTGQNFDVNIKKNTWHCFRCNSGGGPLSWLAVREGVIDCSEAQKKTLRGELFWKAVKIAEDEGFDIDVGDLRKRRDIFKTWFRRMKFRHVKMAKHLMKEHYFFTDIDSKTIYVYEPTKGIYTDYGEEKIRTEMQELLGEESTKHRQNEVVNYIQNDTYRRMERPPANIIALRNGLFNLETRELEDFTSDYFVLNAINVEYDSAAECPKILQFIKDIVDESDVEVIQELSGYILYCRYHIHKAVMLIGEGSNGKSTFLELLRNMLGPKNVSTISLQELENNRFAVENLYGKMANIYPDLPDEALKRTGTFKTLTGGDTVQAQKKFVQRMFDFKNYAKLIFSANKIPETPDDTTAFFRRWIIINFPNQFLPDNPKTDPNILKKITTPQEISGFFNWAVEGLQRLLLNDKFSMSSNVEQVRQDYLMKSDSAKYFAETYVEYQVGNVVSKSELYSMYIDFCRKNRLPSCTDREFGNKLPQHVYWITASKQTIDGQFVWGWRDIKVTYGRSKEQIEVKFDKGIWK